MRKTLTVYYDPKKHGDIGQMTRSLAGASDSQYYGRSNSEIARMVLLPALEKELLRFKGKASEKQRRIK